MNDFESLNILLWYNGDCLLIVFFVSHILIIMTYISFLKFISNNTKTTKKREIQLAKRHHHHYYYRLLTYYLPFFVDRGLTGRFLKKATARSARPSIACIAANPSMTEGGRALYECTTYAITKSNIPNPKNSFWRRKVPSLWTKIDTIFVYARPQRPTPIIWNISAIFGSEPGLPWKCTWKASSSGITGIGSPGAIMFLNPAHNTMKLRIADITAKQKWLVVRQIHYITPHYLLTF